MQVIQARGARRRSPEYKQAAETPLNDSTAHPNPNARLLVNQHVLELLTLLLLPLGAPGQRRQRLPGLWADSAAHRSLSSACYWH